MVSRKVTLKSICLYFGRDGDEVMGEIDEDVSVSPVDEAERRLL